MGSTFCILITLASTNKADGTRFEDTKVEISVSLLQQVCVSQLLSDRLF